MPNDIGEIANIIKEAKATLADRPAFLAEYGLHGGDRVIDKDKSKSCKGCKQKDKQLADMEKRVAELKKELAKANAAAGNAA
ncbi:hypothetical protein IWX92DRAFT_400575 [Phyllosticta citricarpa]